MHTLKTVSSIFALLMLLGQYAFAAPITKLDEINLKTVINGVKIKGVGLH